ncbi:copper binding plastocyanin/azurin family protein [Pontibacter ummariensis]|uniref:Copper binding protein, plastocyanin/azurin family n=1 Tax=Pontibacter ummariensis TaxID=1610492 RepID=A0A239FM34_9BACT|nr:plastocyanin/azurin family copper-binding protein [Pontibacter ummariensis]PRY12022.1 copper binding plastocyanin/azurin family protein [Pontibacter ummariensis]SNS57668.1 Copper binding protein, plastocyanin/azurin family [Pontibacter ummariensis]
MKKTFYIVLATFLLATYSCQQAEEENVVTEVAPAVVENVPVEEEPDTTLQPVEELILHAVGNTLEEIAYAEDTLTVSSGALVKMVLVNEGIDMPMVHNVVFTQPGAYQEVALAAEEVGASGNYVPDMPLVVAASPMALPGQTVELNFTAPTEPGAYDFVCTYPGHWKLMHGTLLVEE